MDDVPLVDFKFVENYLKDKFLRPFNRRLKYIYFGLDRCDDLFVLSDTEDEDFKYCESMQTTGLIKIKNVEHYNKIISWIDSLKIDRTSSCIFYLGLIMPLLNKIKWDDPAINIVKDSNNVVSLTVPIEEELITIVIARPIDTYFTLTKLQNFVDKYNSIFFRNEGFYFDKSLEQEVTKSISSIFISCIDLYNAGLLDIICYDINLIVLLGLDILVSKSLISKDKEYKFCIRLKSEKGKKCLNYGGLYDDKDLSICTSRDNIFIFPKPKKD